MHAEIIKIGNSKGLRIPKAFLEQCKIKSTVNLTVKNHSLIITPYENIREGWEESFKTMAKKKDDQLLDEDYIDLDTEGWEW
ncbi:MAG TPA: AbrB/MazE/SpoVT family DNA-binding domain-containing protein [Rickettsia endosymbiont of Omalisus fontisbellaquei]|jgi:antitoxin MazE|nr:AbrB/MazE/SpoVT family DNA-binding domain-containing protein [Rickettsia endosymbiont of Omalisus fontisbellaquei]